MIPLRSLSRHAVVMADIPLYDWQSENGAHTCRICEGIVLDLRLNETMLNVQQATKEFKRHVSSKNFGTKVFAKGLVRLPLSWDRLKALTSKDECLLLQQILADGFKTTDFEEAKNPQDIYVLWRVGMHNLDPMELSLYIGVHSDRSSEFQGGFQYDINLLEGKS